MRLIHLLVILTIPFFLISERSFAVENQTSPLETATLGGGCFWCMEAIFEELEGVSSVESGFAGGSGEADYKEVCTGSTGHAEVVRIGFDPKVTTFAEILAVFFTVHDPTTLNRQGGDVGTQYRSVIFYESATQKNVAETILDELAVEKVFNKPVVTQLTPLEHFYKAEDYHQDYFSRNRTQSYCQAVINPKVQKFRQKFSSKLKAQ